jgi:hypothetical protein
MLRSLEARQSCRHSHHDYLDRLLENCPRELLRNGSDSEVPISYWQGTGVADLTIIDDETDNSFRVWPV